MDCELCRIIVEEKFRMVAENEHAIAFICVEPIKEGHVLIQTKRHVEKMGEMGDDEAVAFSRLVDASMRVAEEVFNTGSVFIVNGKTFRSQPHFHGHVIPSDEGGRGLFAAAEGTPFRVMVSPEELKAEAERLRKHF